MRRGVRRVLAGSLRRLRGDRLMKPVNEAAPRGVAASARPPLSPVPASPPRGRMWPRGGPARARSRPPAPPRILPAPRSGKRFNV